MNQNNNPSQLDWLLNTPCVDLFAQARLGNKRMPRTVHEYQPRELSYLRNDTVDRITCADGTSLSVQASAHHYCSPRNNEGPWDEVEVGFPSVEVPEWLDYRDGPKQDVDNVFGYVPVQLVRDFIAAHGGEVVTTAGSFSQVSE